jgi:hypothetical protein
MGIKHYLGLWVGLFNKFRIALATRLIIEFPFLLGHKVRFNRQTPHKFRNIDATSLNKIQKKTKLAVMAGYQPELTTFPKYIQKYFGELKAQGFTTVFINAISESQKAEFVAQPPELDLYLERDNLGLDFGSWSDFTRWFLNQGGSFNDFEEVLLVNDSMVGPFSSMEPLFTAARNTAHDVVGLTDSYQGTHHLQSYFLLFKKPALATLFLDKHFAKIPYFVNKTLLIQEIEMGLTAAIEAFGLSWCPLFPYLTLAQTSLGEADVKVFIEKHGLALYFAAQNPTHYFAERLFDDFQFPFIKKELLNHNPLQLPCAQRLKDRIQAIVV